MNKLQKIALLTVCLLMLGAYLSLAYFSFPFADDFTYALKGLEPDVLSTVLKERAIWNGRYLSNFLVIFHPLNWGGLLGYRLMSLCLLAFSFLGYYWCFKNLFKRNVLIATVVCFLIFLSILPDIGEAFFWYTGAVTYMPASVLLLVTFVYILREKFSLKTTVLLAFLFFLGSGFNELFALLNIGFLLLNFKRCKFWWILMSWQVLLFCYIWSAPGNEIRGALFTDNHQLFQSLKYTTAYTVRFIGEWLLNPGLYAAAYLLLKRGKNINLPEPLMKSQNVIFLLLFPTIIACFGPIWSTGILGQYRTANFASYLFVPSFFLAVLSVSKYAAQWKLNKTKLALTILCLSIVTWKNGSILLYELVTSKLQRQKQVLQTRVNILEECPTGKCFVPKINEPSRLLIVYPLTQNANHWKNKSYQLYYNSGKVLPK